MTKHFLLFFALLGNLLAQAGAPGSGPVPPDTVVAVVNGKKLTAGDVERILAGASPQVRQNFEHNRKEFLNQYALMQRLVEVAEKNGLSQKSPYKEQLEWARMQVLMQAQINDHSSHIVVQAEEQQKYYEANRDRYTQARVKVIYIPFTPAPVAQNDPKARKVLMEAEAKAKAESLLKQIRAGADFVKLVKEHSEDATSAAKNGDFGTIRGTDNIPGEIKKAIFSLKPGEVSEPLRQPNGYYLFRVEEIGARPYEEVKDEIHREIRDERFREWFESVRKSLEVKFENEAYFSPAPGQ